MAVASERHFMIGAIDFTVRNQPLRATLSEDGSWRCNDDRMEELLNQVCPPPLDWSTDPVMLGRHQLYRAGERLGGKVSVTKS